LNNTVYNNVAAVTPAHLVYDPSGVITGAIENNIFFTNGSNLLTNAHATGGVFWFGNCYFSSGTFQMQWTGTNYGTFAAWKAASSMETVGSGGFSTDPKLVNPGGGGTTHGYNPALLGAYKLQNGSPMVGTGLPALSGDGPQDFYGFAVPSTGFGGTGYNVGASIEPAKSGLLIFGGMIGTPSFTIGVAALWKAGKAIRRNAVRTRRSLLLGR
jgi:hypothetical protein